MSCISGTLLFTKSFTLHSQIPIHSSLPLHPIRSNFSPPLLLPLSHTLCRCTSSPSPSPSPHQDDFLEEEEEVEDEEEESSYGLDVDALESEAMEAVRRYTSSLSRQLIIGISSHYSFFCSFFNFFFQKLLKGNAIVNFSQIITSVPTITMLVIFYNI